MEQLKELLANGRAAFERLSARERRMVAFMSVAVLGFILFAIFTSFASSARRYERRMEEKVAKLEQVQKLAGSYRQAAEARQGIEMQLKASNVRLISYIEEKATQAGLVVPNMTPKGDVGIGDGKIVESSVELTLTDVDLMKLTNFLLSVERGPGVVKVKSLRLEPRPASKTLTAWTTISTYRMKE
jgi:general secretion pathway protein M